MPDLVLPDQVLPDQTTPAWAHERPALEDDDERLLREVPPHHGG